ncbi:MvaI/BcnI family restriction endonuclease [Zunongwangia sp. HRR-M8]|uniref:MvaI/BcnI family restriction endonuclease n=1 Tax=Zunongwangia sp. HRR-M8 TaxID=3015170 RepID=UPI0022DD2BCE|nr:MvaI/BcnI family restriction endonuclease [Zunongwangia sp. HRR-M8]WBL22312.1 MvaI/BcnI family restriction endonuclease [Zunongwangia sp. HRR-M8]
MRKLTKTEEINIKILTENSVSLTLIEPTKTALVKSIMDATAPVRSYLRSTGIHDFNLQKQGAKHNKVLLETLLYTGYKVHKSSTSLYRPKSKKGDPRIWVYKLRKFANPNDILGIIAYEEKLHVFNLTQLHVQQLINSRVLNPLKELVEEISSQENSVSRELLQVLCRLAKKGPIPSGVNADTAVGRTLETALGIPMNSSKLPDYKGIELKSYRGKKENKSETRKTLFGQVPNWKLSSLKSSAEILEAFGYQRGANFQLNCTVSTTKANSQGLILKLNQELEQLIEYSKREGIDNFAVWELEKLHRRLATKHKETFWVKAQSSWVEGVEHFLYESVIHTRKPIISQFDILLERGVITLDHMIKRIPPGRADEKGPFFKIEPDALKLLFPPSKTYNLLE